MLCTWYAKKDVIFSFNKDNSEELCENVAKELTPLAIRSGVTSILKEGRICEKLCGP